MLILLVWMPGWLAVAMTLIGLTGQADRLHRWCDRTVFDLVDWARGARWSA